MARLFRDTTGKQRGGDGGMDFAAGCRDNRRGWVEPALRLVVTADEASVEGGDHQSAPIQQHSLLNGRTKAASQLIAVICGADGGGGGCVSVCVCQCVCLCILIVKLVMDISSILSNLKLFNYRVWEISFLKLYQ